MTTLILGLFVFFAVHVVSSTPMKTTLVRRLGGNPYKGLFALVSLIGLILIIVGKARAPFEPVWNGIQSLRPLTLPLMWVCFILLPAANMKTNIKRYTRHPMLWGILLWSGAHLLVNGDQASMLLFGSFAVYSVYAMISQTRRGAALQTEKVALKYDAIVVAAGTTVFIAIWLLHGVLFGMPL